MDVGLGQLDVIAEDSCRDVEDKTKFPFDSCRDVTLICNLPRRLEYTSEIVRVEKNCLNNSI